MKRAMKHWCIIVGLTFVALLAGCQSGAEKPFDSGDASSLSVYQNWALQPLSNRTHNIIAAEAATALLQTHLRRRQLLKQIPLSSESRYTIEGVVTQWQYAGAVSPRPEVGLQLSVRDLATNTIVWSGTRDKTGKRRQTLTALADTLLSNLVDQIPLNRNSLSQDERDSTAAVEALMEGNAESAVGSMSGGLGLRSTATDGINHTVMTPTPLQGRSTAFYYAPDPPVDVLSQFDRLVLEPDNIIGDDLQQLSANGARTYAYLSVGEVGPQRAYASAMKSSWMLGKNPAWNSTVLDLSNPELREFLIDRVSLLQRNGFQGLFLDTMDSFNLIAKTESQRLAQTAGLKALIKGISVRFPDMALIANRGFEVLDDIAPYLEAVAAESLYAKWDNTRQVYTKVSDNDRAWLLGKLKHAAKALNLDVIAIDYLPPERREEARAVAARIAEHGFIPWVANPELDYVGIGALEVLPRKVLMLYDSAEDIAMHLSAVHRFVATPVEYLGYVPEYLDIATQTLPAGELKGRYAGIVSWAGKAFSQIEIRPWLQKQLDDRVPMVFMGIPPVALDDAMLESMGIEFSGPMNLDSAAVSYRDKSIKPERSMSLRVEFMGLVAESVSPANTVHLSYKDQDNVEADVVVTGPFGGFAWQPGLVEDGLDYETYWVVDPFQFLRTALQLPDAPMPDVTTENGKRLWLAHIDGDALPSWAEMPGRQLGAEIIYDQILDRYKLPHTVSVVEGEMTDKAYDDRRERMYDIARKTFAADHVELASHTYSHPFKWALLDAYRKPGKYNLDIPGYEFSPSRETAGSIGFIDQELAPEDKRTKLMLWSGDALPGAASLAALDKLGIPNMNGGITHATNASPSLTLVSPMARPVDQYLQVYAPIMNENIYTNDWTGPYDGFHRVIETFELTEMPRRLKPLNIYYHFYSGTKIAAMKALTDVYDWTLQQEIHPVFGSDYAIKVPDYRQAGVARYLDGPWKFSALGNVRSIRLLQGESWPELTSSRGITGARQLHDGVYLHTDGSDQVLFDLQSSPPAQVHLVSSNGRVTSWDDAGSALNFRIVGEVPVTVELGGSLTPGCTIQTGGRTISGVASAVNTVTFTFNVKDTGNASLNCPA